MIVGFTGVMGSGKSTAIRLLAELLDEGPALVKFAQPLYDMQDAIYGRIVKVYKRPPEFVKDRKLLQWLGTDWGRDTISQTLWVDLWKERVAFYQACGKSLIVCDDVRFDNEGETLRGLGGHVIHVSSKEALARITTANGISGHKSESGIKPELIDYYVRNDGTIEELRAQLKEALTAFRT